MTGKLVHMRIGVAFLALLISVLVSENVAAQFATAPSYTAGAVGGSCNNSSQNFAWPDSNGYFLHCVSSLWVVANQPGTAAGSTGYVQYNNSGALAGSANLFWNNGSSFLGIGTATPANTLDVKGAVAVGTYAGQAAPSNGLMVSGNVGIGSASPNANLDLGSGSLSLGSGLGTTMTTLSGTINASVTTIPVVSTANYSSAGTIALGGEYAICTGKTGTSFTGCTRGAYGTTAASHTSGALIVGLILGNNFAYNGEEKSNLAIYNNGVVVLGALQGDYLNVNDALVFCGGSNGNSGSNSLIMGNGEGASVPAGEETNSIGIGGFPGSAFGNNSQAWSGTATRAFAEEAIGRYANSTGSENATSWAGTVANPVLLVGIGTSGVYSNALMVFQNGQMLVNGGTTVGVPAGGASLTPMGISVTSADAALNTTNKSGTSLFYVRDDGNVGIGTTSPAYLLHDGSASVSGVVIEYQNSSGACTYQPGASSSTLICSSDIRLKSNIEDSGDALGWLGATRMRVRDFTVKATGERTTGVIAQEMLTSHPEIVHMGGDGLYKVEVPSPWVLVKALQELDAVHHRLKSANVSLKADDSYEAEEIAALSARINQLEGRQ